MSVESSLDPVCGSIPMDRLEQFVEEDKWYFLDEDGESDSEDNEIEVEQDPEESILPKEGSWIQLCKSSSIPANSPPKTKEDQLIEQSMGLQSVIDCFLSKLDPYNAAYDEDEATDDSGKRESDTQLLLLEREAEETQRIETPSGTLEQEATIQVPEENLRPESEEEKDHAKPHLPVSSGRPKYFFIAKEILTSERTFVQGIRLLEKVLHGAVKTARDTGKPMIPESLRKTIFINISEIYTLNNDFLNELEVRIENWNKNSVVCDVLASRAPYFKLYSIYASCFEDSQTAYGETLKNFKPFNDLVQHIENSNLCKGLPVSSYLLYPIQRIPRYKLLLKEYLKHLPENHSDRDHTERALMTISEVAQHLNDRIKDLEEQATVVKLQKLFVGKETLVVPGRKFILRGAVELMSSVKLRKRQTKVLFLFTDVLIMTKITRKIKFKIQMKFYMSDIQVSSMHSHSMENDFCIFVPSVSKPFRFCSRNRKERDLWVKHLRKSLTLEMEKRKSFEVKVNPITSINQRSMQTIFQDPSFESRQPKCVRRAHQHYRQMIISPSPSADSAGMEETDSGAIGNIDFMLEMEEMIDLGEGDGTTESAALKPGQDNTLSSYISCKREGSSGRFEEVWFVLTYTGLTGYYNHKTDRPCWAVTLYGCKMILSQQSTFTFKLLTPHDCVTHVFKLDNEYDYFRWTGVLQEILNSDINRL